MKFLNMFVSFLSGIAIAIGAAYIVIGLWGVSSPDSLVDFLGGGWVSNDYLVWGLILPIVGYLGLVRAKAERGERANNG